ncbi:MAG: hypothetical protein JNK14_00300 [Chitinophagaceae bacterium]|nr:hypothetical protein [Chitinophagaceae bacterium]
MLKMIYFWFKQEPPFAKATANKNKKGEGRFSFTFLRREISPAKDEQQSCYIYDNPKLKPILKNGNLHSRFIYAQCA